MTPPFRSSNALLLVSACLLLWVYTHRISSNPLTWEEPRRCLVSSEMIRRGDYVVPHVMGEPYMSKPPLQNWLIVLLSGNSASRVGALPLRAISVASVMGVALLLYALRRALRSRIVAWLPAVIFLTMGNTVQYGSSGEIDPLFTLWIMAALAAFEIGRRRDSPWVQWFVSQALLAGGILTKGLAPLFFYPPVLWLVCRSRSRSRSSAKAFALGLMTEAALVAAWVIPYSRRAEVASLARNLTHQVAQRTPLDQGVLEFLKNLVYFPMEAFGSTLPWSLLLLLWLHPAMRKLMRERMGDDPLVRLSAAVALWAFVALWFTPGAMGRYWMPAHPFLALLLAQTMECSASVLPEMRPMSVFRWLHTCVRRAFIESRVGWILLIGAWCAAVMYAGLSAPGRSVWQPLCAGLLAILTAGYWARHREKRNVLLSGLLLVAVMYAIVYVGLVRVQRAEKDARSVAEAGAIASLVEEPLPIVCATDVPYSICYLISQRLDRPVQRRAPADGRWYLVAKNPGGQRGALSLIGRAATVGLWTVDPSLGTCSE